jgi:hypothetical protein
MEQSETAYNRSITSPAARVATPVIKEEPVNTIKKPEPVKSQVKEEIKEERESSVLPDYLRDFFADESEPVKPQTEITGQLQDRDPTTTFNSVSANSDDDDEDDAIVIDRKI